ncbi:MAG: hypothetical protein OXH05_13320 [Acidobacteria bacterium]|nr:hypothetical protein [Acidobacteriota bacterium]
MADSTAGRVYVVLLNESNAREELIKRIHENYSGEGYKGLFEVVPGSAYLVRTADLTSKIADKVGIGGENPEATGVVLKVNDAYHGFYHTNLWDWLGK